MIVFPLAVWFLAQWTAFGASPDPKLVIDGYWQSCADDEGHAERIYDAQAGYELHLGPGNLLGPSFTVHDVTTWRGKKSWTVPSLHLRLTATEAGGSREDCSSYVVRLERTR